MNVSAEVI